MAPTGFNGDNETSIGLSHTVSISFSETDGNEIPISNSSQLIDVWIPRDPNSPRLSPIYVNTSFNNRPGSQLFPIAFNVTSSNASIHLEFAPLNSSVGYVILLKFNMTPKLNSTYQDYDSWRLFCPQGKLSIQFKLQFTLKKKFK